MRDASDYMWLAPGEEAGADALPSRPGFWRATGSHEDAMKAATAPKSAALEVVVNHGRWIVECPDCHDAQLASRHDPRFMCVACGNASVGGKWRRVTWPAKANQIEELLEVRVAALQNWAPGETVADLKAENELLASGAVLIGGTP